MNATIVPAQVIPMLRSVNLVGPAGRLEAVVNEGAPNAPFAALVCHPHPKGGGNLHNKVVYHAMKALNDPQWGLSWPVLRFNFRGTGLSEGTYDGQAEAGDVLAALAWLENEYKRPLVLVGFSFGAGMSIAACCANDNAPSSLRALVALGLPLQDGTRVYGYPSLKNSTLPKLFLSGDHDQFAPVNQLEQVAASAAEPKQLVLIPGADHFFTGHLSAMQTSLVGWLQEHFL
jgi:alpha/beta superfamily hydrolase